MAQRFERLKRPLIRKLPPGSRITERGIIVERLSNGDIRYSVNIMVDSQRIHRVIGKESEGTTRTQAEEFITKVRGEAKERRLKLPKGRKLDLTFETAANMYIERLEQSGGKNIKEKRWHLRLYLMPYFGSMRLENINIFTLEKFQRHCSDRGLSQSTTNQLLATYRHIGRKLHEWGVINFIPPMVKMQAAKNARDYVLSAAEKWMLLDEAKKDSNGYIWLFIMLGLQTSLRHAEILSARFANLDADRRRLLVNVKGGLWREQPLTRYITDVLVKEREVAADHVGWIFPNAASTSGHYESMKAPFRRIAIAAGFDLKKVTPHTLRHTAITDMAETGATVKTVQEFSGHTSIEMVMRYTHAREEQVNNALDEFERRGTNHDHPARRKRESS